MSTLRTIFHSKYIWGLQMSWSHRLPVMQQVTGSSPVYRLIIYVPLVLAASTSVHQTGSVDSNSTWCLFYGPMDQWLCRFPLKEEIQVQLLVGLFADGQNGSIYEAHNLYDSGFDSHIRYILKLYGDLFQLVEKQTENLQGVNRVLVRFQESLIQSIPIYNMWELIIKILEVIHGWHVSRS